MARRKKLDAEGALKQLEEGLGLANEALDVLKEAAGEGGEGGDDEKSSGGRRRRRASGDDDGNGDDEKKSSGRRRKPKGPSREDVRAKIMEVAEAFCAEDAEEILTDKGGVKKVSDLDEKDFQAVIDECDAALKEAEEND